MGRHDYCGGPPRGGEGLTCTSILRKRLNNKIRMKYLKKLKQKKIKIKNKKPNQTKRVRKQVTVGGRQDGKMMKKGKEDKVHETDGSRWFCLYFYYTIPYLSIFSRNAIVFFLKVL